MWWMRFGFSIMGLVLGVFGRALIVRQKTGVESKHLLDLQLNKSGCPFHEPERLNPPWLIACTKV